LHCRAETIEALLYPDKLITISADRQGIIIECQVEEGDTVQSGDLLVRQDDTEDRLLVKRAQKTVEKRQFDFTGLEQLRRKQMASEDEALQAKMDLEIAKIDLENARNLLERKHIKAPIQGIITGIMKDEGEWVQPGEPILELTDINTLEAVFYIPAKQAQQLHRGQILQLKIEDFPQKSFEAKIRFIAPQVDSSSGLVCIKAAVPNEGHPLKPGLTGTISL